MIRHVQFVDRLRRHPVVADSVLALVLTGIGVVGALSNHKNAPQTDAIAIALLTGAPLALRRVYPRPVFAVVVAATVAAALASDSYLPFGAIVVFYTLAAHVQRPESIRLGAVGLVALAIVIPFAGSGGWQITLTLVKLAPFVGAWVLGDNLRTRRAYLRALEDRAAQLEREQEANARRAAAEEQARIAREVHDIVAHNLSVIVVQATAADNVFESKPADARRAVRTIEGTARRALEELRRVLGVVGGDEPGAGLAPQPGLAGIEELADNLRAAGLDVGVEVQGDVRELSPAFELSAYRIVQEALTNTLRHAHARHATVTVGFDPGELTLEVVDDGTTSSGNGAGRGLVGMRERAAVFGGTVDAGPVDGGGFRVMARLPLT